MEIDIISKDKNDTQDQGKRETSNKTKEGLIVRNLTLISCKGSKKINSTK